jgi:maltose alpha-D-glucosyltransferase / alpha-amylase
MAFPPIAERPYILTLAPYAFHWFALEPPLGAAVPPSTVRATSPVPTLTASGPWAAVIRGETAAGLGEVLLEYLQRCRWFGGRGERILSMTHVETVAVVGEPTPAYLTLFQVEYAEADPEIYVLPLAFATGAPARELLRHGRQAVIARLRLLGLEGWADGVLYDAMWDPRVVRSLLSAVVRRRRLRGRIGTLQGTCTAAVGRTQTAAHPSTMSISPPREESNTTVVCGEWGSSSSSDAPMPGSTPTWRSASSSPLAALRTPRRWWAPSRTTSASAGPWR